MMLNKSDILAMLGAGVMIVITMEALVWAITSNGIFLRG